ncbi:hypothetical protein [Thalassotalea sediminis]|uniref:hypothetical protein n=1 Tax=Thalassotalea sediminis TaxID=1759089 RepID=UPI0025747179|nr:hypothetical protein [Thalassotalea sediminis]
MLKKIALVLILSSNCIAEEIPIPAKAKVFYEQSDNYPQLINFFTTFTETELVNYYQSHLGTPSVNELKRGHRQLTFSHEKDEIRIIISSQINATEVSIIKVKNPAN